MDRQHWSIEEIPYHAIDPHRTDHSAELLYLLSAASFVEITSDLYARKLIEYFRSDEEVRGWLECRWRREEVQHGTALKYYIHAVWPDFDWDRAYSRFYDEYSMCCAAKELGPTRALEMAARCLVEVGTATLYTMLARLSVEPVLRALMGRIRSDEVRHYSHFYRYFARCREQEKLPRYMVLRTLCGRISEVNDEDAYYGFKHAFLERRGGQFHQRDYEMFCRYYRNLARTYYPYEMAVKMFLKPLELKRWMRKVIAPAAIAGARYLS